MIQFLSNLKKRALESGDSVQNRFILSLFLLFTIVFHFIAYTGHFGYDDLHYAKLAAQLNNGFFDASDHYSFRWSILAFTTLCYKIFGINDFASSLPAFILFVSIIFMVYTVLKNENRQVLLIGLSLTVFSQSLLFYSDKLMPDIYVAFFALLALYTFWNHRYHKKKKDLFYAFLMVFSLFMGFLSKGTIILVIPLFIYLLIVDLILKRSIRFWIYATFSGIGLFLMYILIVWLITGNPFQRFQALESNAYLSLCSYGNQPLTMVLQRISTGFLNLLLHQGVSFGFIFIIVFFLHKVNLDLLRFNNSFSFFLLSSTILLLSSNFMTISVSEYNPMCLDTRHYLFLVPIIAIPASRIIFHFNRRGYRSIQILSLLFLAIIFSYFTNGSLNIEVYTFLFVLFLVKYLTLTPFKKPFYFSIIVSAILLISPIKMAFYAQKVKYNSQKKFVRNEIIGNMSNATIVTDDIQKRLGDYYMGFESKDGVKFESFKNFKWNDLDEKKYLLINPYTAYIAQHDIPFYAKVISEFSSPIYSEDNTKISLYEFSKMPTLLPLVESFNDFEQNYRHWNKDITNNNDENVYAGSFGNYIPEYSSNFKYSFDSAFNANPKSIIINAQFKCLLKRQSQPQFTIVLEKEGAEYHRELRPFNHYIKSIDHWWDVKLEVLISKENIESNSTLFIYIWNPQKKEMYIDNFKIEVSRLE